MTPSDPGPMSFAYMSQRLRLQYVDWGNEGAPHMLLLHGGRDHCRSWDWVARAMRDDYHVIAPDFRGHGDSQWAIGSSYPFADFVYDIDQLMCQKRMAPATIISHSMGGVISLMYAGLFPQKVEKLIVIEGTWQFDDGINALNKDPVVDRFDHWMAQMRDSAARTPRKYETLDAAVERMRQENPRLSEEQAWHLTRFGSNMNEDGTFSWKFDNYMRAIAPATLDEHDVKELWGRITCPVLLFYGNQSYIEDPRKKGLLDLFQDVRLHEVDGAGHWLHHDELDEFLSVSKDFLKNA